MKLNSKSRARGKRNQRHGATAVEFAVTAIPFLVIILGILEFGRITLVKDLLKETSREAVRIASVNTDVKGGDDNDLEESQIKERVGRLVEGHGLKNVSIDFSHAEEAGADWKSSATSQDRIDVTITADYTPFTPLFSLLTSGKTGAIEMRAVSVGYSEGH